MANYGKIARLPREIRDELNRRLDNGETGARLVEWLNGLTKVRKILERDFAGREISEQNLTEWKAHGYLDWQGQQQALALTQELKANGKELAAVSAGELTECLATVVAARYAVALYGWNGEMTEEMRRNIRGLRGLGREVVRLRRSDQRLEEMKIKREWLALERQKSDEGMKKRLNELAEDKDFRNRLKPKMTKEEMDRGIYRLIYGRDKEEVEQAKVQARKPNVYPASPDSGATSGPKGAS